MLKERIHIRIRPRFQLCLRFSTLFADLSPAQGLVRLSYFRAKTFFSFFVAPPLSLSSLSRTAATIIGNPTVASTNTSPNMPPSAGGTNFPQETASLYGLPDKPPQ